MRLANPKPGFCSSCYAAAPDRRFVDFEAAYDGTPILHRENQTIEVLPWDGRIASHDDLYLCENCVREAGEILGFKPELHSKQFNEIRRQELEIEHWKSTAKRLQAELDVQFESAFGPTKPRRRVAA